MTFPDWAIGHIDDVSLLLPLCEENSSVTNGFPSEAASVMGVDVFYVVSMNRLIYKQPCCRWYEASCRDAMSVVRVSVYRWRCSCCSSLPFWSRSRSTTSTSPCTAGTPNTSPTATRTTPTRSAGYGTRTTCRSRSPSPESLRIGTTSTTISGSDLFSPYKPFASIYPKFAGMCSVGSRDFPSRPLQVRWFVRMRWFIYNDKRLSLLVYVDDRGQGMCFRVGSVIHLHKINRHWLI